MLWDSGRLENFVEDDRGKTNTKLKQETSLIHLFDGIRTWSPSVLRPKKDFFVSCSASHGMVSSQILCYRRLPPFTPCRASYTHFRWRLGWFGNVAAV